MTIQTRTITTTDDGKPVESWSTFATVWASVEQITAREELRAKQEVAKGNYIVTCRYISGVKETMQIIWGDKTLQINSVVENQRVIEIEASEVK